MEYVQLTDAEVWQFDSLPAFTGGKMHPLFADAGKGLFAADKSSFMHIFTEVSAAEITGYADRMREAGFSPVFTNEISGNLFYQFRVPEGLFNITYMHGMKTARFILDRCQSAEADAFGDKGFEAVRENTVFAQYSLHYDKMIRGTTCDCGMNYVFRLRDNRLIIIDGGEMEQSTDLAVKDYMAFLHELTGTADGEKMTVALWLCTHPHNDHSDFFAKLLRFHSDELFVERAAFNFPAPENVKHSPSVADCMARLTEKFPQVAYIKPHAGCRFTVGNAEFEVYSAAEDALGTGEDGFFPGTNETSLIFSVKADGAKILFLADCAWDNGSVLTENFSEEALACDIVQAGHHGINNTEELYAKIHADYVLLPQCRMNMETRFTEVLATLDREYGAENVYLAHDRTDFFTLQNGTAGKTERAHAGEAWDGSEW